MPRETQHDQGISATRNWSRTWVPEQTLSIHPLLYLLSTTGTRKWATILPTRAVVVSKTCYNIVYGGRPSKSWQIWSWVLLHILEFVDEETRETVVKSSKPAELFLQMICVWSWDRMSWYWIFLDFDHSIATLCKRSRKWYIRHYHIQISRKWEVCLTLLVLVAD